MQKLLIAEPSKILADALRRKLLTRYDVSICSSGRDALKFLNEKQPDALIINLSLCETDGLTVLRNAARIPPTILALTYIANDEISHAAASCGIGGLLLLPCTLNSIIRKFDELTQQ